MTIRQQLFTLLRNLRWIIAIAAVICVLLYLPDQIRELYRIAAADAGWITVKEFIAIILIAVVIWLGAFQLTTESVKRIAAADPIHGRMTIYARIIPILLGLSPILAAMLGQLAARPGQPHLSTDRMNVIEEVGSIFRIEAQALASDRRMLLVFAAAFLGLIVLFVHLAWRAGAKGGLIAFSERANDAYFSAYKFLALTVAAIAALTFAFIMSPASLAQFVGTFGVIALFTICVVGFTIHLSLLTIEHELPLLPAIFAVAFLIAIFGTNDDHQVRPVPYEAASKTADRASAVVAFENWIKQPSRIAEASKLGEYPVFVVSAQGGGIYAADNAAKFLARMQDLCPTFRQHLFAVSSVSGGSVGAAVFAAALHAEPQTGLDNASAQPCPRIAEFLSGITHTEDIDVPGPVEQRVDSILATDFLAPLTAGFLFSDFTQLFTPFPVPFFDRARFLEYTLEDAADRMLKSGNDTGSRSNLLKADYQSHWTPDNAMPALLLNTTDVGSGKRVVISPFDIDESHPKDSGLCMLANLKREGQGADAKVTSGSLHIPLSTAAFMSARFPWVTPATTVTLKNDCITENPIARLVDGGYVENSGVETALDLIEKLNSIQGISDAPKFRIYLMSLASGDFPDHGTFSLGELMEPVRALLSTRSSRTYIALSRAAHDERLPTKDGQRGSPAFDTFGRTDISSLFYNLPLGWTLSDKTGDIVSLSSGRFWDCLPNDHFVQGRAEQSNADCLQIRVFHLLNGSVASAFQTLKDSALAETYASYLAGESVPKAKIDQQPLLACYESKWFQDRRYKKYQGQAEAYPQRLKQAAEANKPPPAPVPTYRQGYLAFFQTEQVKALLQEWDRLEETDPRILAYVLGSVSYDSSDFARKSENFSFSNKSQIPPAWIKRIDQFNAAQVAKGQAPVDIGSLLDHPQQFANFILGSEGNKFGNRPGTDDGWQFRPRGMYQLVGREQYTGAQQANRALGQLSALDLVAFPDALWNTNISAKITFAHFRTARYEGRTLFEVLKDKSLDWKGVRALQKDMDHGDADQTNVAERSDMFLGCIAEASAPSRPRLLEQLLNQL